MAETSRQARRLPINRQLELLKERNAARTRDLLIRCVAVLIGLAISPIPLRWVYYSLKELAGKETRLSLGVTVTLSLYGVAATLRAISSARKARYWKEEFRRVSKREVPHDD